MTLGWVSKLLCKTSTSFGVSQLLSGFSSVRTGAENHSITEVFSHGVKLEAFLIPFLSSVDQEGTNLGVMGAFSITRCSSCSLLS